MPWELKSPVPLADYAGELEPQSERRAEVRDALAGFRGVLVSDFYGGYEGVDCPQQKCLVHLARDLNDELVGSPFDDDLKRSGRCGSGSSSRASGPSRLWW